MEEKKIICITCPIGCNVTVRGDGQGIESVEGFKCKRGDEYARNEFINPQRILTSTVSTVGAPTPLLPVRSNKPVPKHLMFKCMDEIRKLSITAPASRYDVVIPNILDTGADIIATSDI